MCCGSCVSAVEDALGAVQGVTEVTADQKSKTVAFKATDEKSAKAGLDALAKAGFHGSATFDKKEASFPAAEIKKGTKSSSVTIAGVHLCCGACVTGVKKGLKDVKGIEGDLAVDREAKTVTVAGKDLDVSEVFEALYKAGYHGNLKTEKP